MNRLTALLLTLTLALGAAACGWAAPTAPAQPEEEIEMTDQPLRITITVNDRAFAATLNDSAAAAEFYRLLPLTADMAELNGNEKYHTLSEGLTAADRDVGAVAAGDLMLYRGDCLVLFYEGFSTSYRYTPLGALDDPAGLAAAVGGGDVRVSFERAS